MWPGNQLTRGPMATAYVLLISVDLLYVQIGKLCTAMCTFRAWEAPSAEWASCREGHERMCTFRLKVPSKLF